jgi:hypothetical protein
MKEGSYQFIHVDAYAREGSSRTTTEIKKNGDKIITTKKVRGAKEILEEQARIDGACPHINEPRNPGLLYGVPPLEVLTMVNEWAVQATDARGHKLRKDGLCVLVGVISLPRNMEDNFPEFAENSLIWLKEKYGDRLKSVVVHDDEAHPHLHFSVVPSVGEKFEDIHEGYKASKQAKIENKKKGEQNLAYINAMRAYQDEFSQKVAMNHGLTRIGPGRRRLTRAQWKAEKAQAAFFSDAKAQHRVARKNGYKVGLKKAENETKAIGAQIGNFFAGALGGFHKPTAQALDEAEKIKKDAEKEKKKAEIYKKQAKEWADKRVATVGNQITVEKSKNKILEEDLKNAEEKIVNLTKLSNWYEKKFGNAPDNLPKIK